MKLFVPNKPTTKEQIIKELEKNIQKVWDESIILKNKKEFQNAKEKGTMAIEIFHEYKSKNQDYINIDLEFGLKLNLALINHQMDALEDAKVLYQDILKLENYYSPVTQHHKIRINLGNILYQQGEYKPAITEYKKAKDKISKENKELRANIMKNIGMTHIKMGNYGEAIEEYSESLKSNPDIRTAMNLLLCHLAIGDIENTKNVFNVMLDISAYYVNIAIKFHFIRLARKKYLAKKINKLLTPMKST